jgi:hypothetical protein
MFPRTKDSLVYLLYGHGPHNDEGIYSIRSALHQIGPTGATAASSSTRTIRSPSATFRSTRSHSGVIGLHESDMLVLDEVLYLTDQIYLHVRLQFRELVPWAPRLAVHPFQCGGEDFARRLSGGLAPF